MQLALPKGRWGRAGRLLAQKKRKCDGSSSAAVHNTQETQKMLSEDLWPDRFFTINNSPSEHFLAKGLWSNLPSLFPHLHQDGDAPFACARYPESGGGSLMLSFHSVESRAAAEKHLVILIPYQINKQHDWKLNLQFFGCKIHAGNFTYWSHAYIFFLRYTFFGDFLYIWIKYKLRLLCIKLKCSLIYILFLKLIKQY